MDGHSSHCSNVELLDYAVANDVILFCLPSHSTHWLQPLDRSFFKPLKTYWSKTCQNWVHNNPGRKLGRLQFASLLNAAWCKAATIQNGTSGFRTCGIYPFNPEQIPDYVFVLDKVAQVQENLNPEKIPSRGKMKISTFQMSTDKMSLQLTMIVRTEIHSKTFYRFLA
ncbi:hypothetical protein NQ314_010590 [Rhamnusium bicolor]|uniref:DDE-1 domain-containing protein n=1 Tax=Rhamnusium bicolor TaxID=1586634 RepID=A0AAV8XNW8_9CUCU|nr:hypothetical protein NQ314_010590 [Rhamnusium bicolor]